MNKIKDFFKVKRNIAILYICVLAVITIAVVAVLVLKKKPVTNEVIPTVQGSETTSSETVSEKEVVVQPIVVDEVSSTSSAVSSKAEEKTVALKVDGNTSSKVAISKPQVKTTDKATSKQTTNKPKPPVSSEPAEPQSPVSSEPTEPIEIPYNPDGPQHGDTDVFNGETQYFHVGADAYIDEGDWKYYKFGQHPESDRNTITSNKTIYLNNGDLVPNEGIWCDRCKVFVIDKNLTVHDSVLHKK